jgi:hypothetical protein
MPSISNKEDVKEKPFGSNCACILVIILFIIIMFINLPWFNSFFLLLELSYVVAILNWAKWIIVVIILIILILRNFD